MLHHRKFGWKPNLPDHRDKQYQNHPEMFSVSELPSSVDFRAEMSQIEDQGQLGSCVAHATAAALEQLELVELKGHGGPEVFDTQFEDISRLFIYFNARALDGNTSQDCGTHLRSAVQAVQKWGICRESLWPYIPAKVFDDPGSAAYLEGTSHLVLEHYSLNNTKIIQLKQCLAQKSAIIFGMSIYDSFMSQASAQSGMIPLPTYDEDLLGGHALCCVGYDDHKNGGSFIVRNSWGMSWGESGYCYIPYSYLTNRNLASDFWTLRKAE